VSATQSDTPLVPILRRLIAEQGPISVAAYMALALGHPRHGYYMTRDPFGARGDFTTAPEISQLFGESLAVWCALAWAAMGRPAPVRLVELGPGRGTLMADLTRTLDRIAPDLARAAALHLVESSPVLRRKQEEVLKGRRASWHPAIEQVPRGPMLLVANEFFDALPIQQFVRSGGDWRERKVDWDAGTERLVFRAGPPLRGAVPPALAAAPEGSIYETSPVAAAIAEEIGARLAAAPGAALVVDYGRRATGAGDTLAAIEGGRKDADPLAAPGEADLTAHVDFEALAAAFAKGGARCRGPATQRDLLRALGIEARLTTLRARADAAQGAALESGARRLIAPEGMGTLFLALAATSRDLPAPPGFETQSTG
jgi:NADH dehydrogenase [ubiquinone] 1 alpha subcomplex assembly factor 7